MDRYHASKRRKQTAFRKNQAANDCRWLHRRPRFRPGGRLLDRRPDYFRPPSVSSRRRKYSHRPDCFTVFNINVLRVLRLLRHTPSPIVHKNKTIKFLAFFLYDAACEIIFRFDKMVQFVAQLIDIIPTAHVLLVFQGNPPPVNKTVISPLMALRDIIRPVFIENTG